MVTIEIPQASHNTFRALTGHAFEQSRGAEIDCVHGFWWAWRWLRTQISGGWEKEDRI